MADILTTIQDSLPRGVISSTIFEGANIVAYTTDTAFFKNGDAQIKEIVNTIKKRLELRADKSILLKQEETEQKIKEICKSEKKMKAELKGKIVKKIKNKNKIIKEYKKGD